MSLTRAEFISRCIRRRYGSSAGNVTPPPPLGLTTRITASLTPSTVSAGSPGFVALGIAKDHSGTPTGDPVYYESLVEAVATVDNVTGAGTRIGAGTPGIKFSLTPAPPSVFTEPLFDASRHTMIKAFNVDAYTGLSDAWADGWTGFNGTAAQDTHIADLAWAPVGPTYEANLLSSETHDSRVGGQSLLLKYFGINDDAGDETIGAYNEGHQWVYSHADRLAGMPGKPFIHSYYRRIDYLAGTGHVDCDDPASPTPNGRTIQQKCAEYFPFPDMYHSGEFGRLQTHFSYSPNSDYINIPFATVGGYGDTLQGVHCGRTDLTGDAATANNGIQSGGPFPYQYIGNPGTYHRVTVAIMTNSSPTALDGYMLMWIDGTLIIGIHPDLVGVRNPNNPDVGSAAVYCNLDNLQTLYHELAFSTISLGDIANQTTRAPFNMYFDRMSIYRGT